MLRAAVASLGALAASAASAQSAVRPGEPMVGCYPCDSLVQRYWHDVNSAWAERESIALLRENGFEWIRVGITTQSHPELEQTSDWSSLPWKGGYWSCREVGARVLTEAAAAGMKLYLFLFLSDTAAHGGQQIPPVAWQSYDVPQTCQALEQYCFETVAYLRGRGLDIDIYEVGNEIERGICGFRPDERVPRPPEVDQLRNIEWLRESIWEPEARMLTAAIRGIKRADPEGKIVLHVGTRPSPEDAFVVAFFEAMASYSVPFDYAGLSVYPWIGYPSSPPQEDWRADLERWVSGIEKLGKPVIICEYSYPHHPPAPLAGMVASALPGYPFTPEGQAAWVREFLRWCEATPNVAGSFYFYPDHAWRPNEPDAHTEGLFLFDGAEVRAMPALLEFGGSPASAEH